MTPRLRRLSGRDVIRALGSLGFEVVGVSRSHAKLRRVTESGERQTLTVPLHDELAPGTSLAIYRQARRFVSDGLLRPLFYK